MSSKIFSLFGVGAILAGASVACSGEGDEPPDQLPQLTGGYGSAPAGGAGGAVTGGVTGGGAPGGGAPSNGGASVATGGVAQGAGGAFATGGVPSAGGAAGNGGLPGSGGDPGAGGVPATGGTVGTGGTAGAGGGTERPDQGKGDGKDVIAIGDSWMSLGFDGIQVALVRASGQQYRTYGVAGTQLLNGQIPGQYTSAKRANPTIKTVVMTGGGNDVLLQGLASDCANGGSRCAAQLQKIAEGLGTLWKQMAADGVQDIVHVMYARDAGQGTKDDPAVGLKKVCDAVPPPTRCHLFATDTFVNGQYQLDGIHPNSAAYGRIGKGVFDYMVANGIRR